MKNIFRLSFVVTVLFPVWFLASCKDNSVGSEEEKDKPYIEINDAKVEDGKLTFSRFASAQSISINTNLDNITCKKVTDVDWYSIEYSDKKLLITVKDNTDSDNRMASVLIQGDNAKKTLTIIQEYRNTNPEDVKGDIKISVKNAVASSSQSGEGIEYSFDGKYDTFYHSSWNNSAADYFPITLSYHLEATESMDFLVYHPRRDGGRNGHICEFELWVATESSPQLTKYGEYDFLGSSSSSRISFVPALVKPTQVQFVVKSGAGDDQGFVSCSEMEFYRKNPDNFDYLDIFSDVACSKLKAGITEEQINAISNPFFKELAIDIYKGIYDMEFRVQEYKSWQNPDIMAEINKTNQYSLRDNPTGIYSKGGEDLIVFAEGIQNRNISLFVQNPTKNISGESFSLADGINKIRPTISGLIYIMYHTATGDDPSVKIHIATGNVNGYFDNQKHQKEDWSRLLSNATFEHFDLVGKYAHLTFETSAFKRYTEGKGLELIDLYDKLVYDEQTFMGLVKYNKMFKNRSYFLVVYGDNFMYATSYYTGYNNGTQNEVLNPEKFRTTAIWGPAHELGHVNQTRPGLKWHGMTEVTNNIHSQYIQTSWGNPSRLMTEDLGGGLNRYQKALNEIVNAKVAHNEPGGDVFCKLVPFWQLKLYMHDALGKTDFYPDIYEEVRKRGNPQTDGECQLQFVKIACDIAQLDLTAFFDKWGFLKPINIEIDDYAKRYFVVTQEQIDAVKAEIAAKNYPKPKHDNIHLINDNNVNDYK